MENVIRIDINFLNRPLYFQNIRYTIGKKFVWTDIEGYEYHSAYTPPDYIDMLILFYFLLRSQEKGYTANLYLTRYEIIKSCGFTKSPKTYARIQDSLERWSAVYLKFNGIFYDRQKYLTKFFHILKASINKETQKVEVVFDSDWLLKIKESNFFKYLNFEYYKALKRPISRRLYEILSPKCYDGKEWHIHATKFGTDIPISKRKVRTKEGAKEVIYASDVLTAIRPGINEINRLAKSPDITEKAKVLPGDVFTVEYRITGQKQDRLIHFKTHRVELAKKKELPEPINSALPHLQQDKAELQDGTQVIPDPHQIVPTALQANKPEKQSTISSHLQQTYCECIAWLESIPGFHPDRKQEIYALPMEQIVKDYPDIRKKYEAMKEKNKKPTPGWVYSAFKNKYIFPEDIKQAKKKEQEAERKAVESHTQEVKKFIEEKGGIRNLLYGNKKITSEHPEYGLTLKSDNGSEDGVLWKNVKVEDFTLKE
ncbi:MAG: replication initiation protein [Candidatus Omnitrophica bacterium]|nr:replication initiation protein [Candidatus Omnitrophota bacterium]